MIIVTICDRNIGQFGVMVQLDLGIAHWKFEKRRGGSRCTCNLVN